MMSDPLLEAQLASVFNYPVQSMCFIVGGILVFAGMGMATIIPAGKWKLRGSTLLVAGALIAFPAVIPMMLKIIGGSTSDLSLLPQWFLSTVYIVIPITGIIFGIYGWLRSTKQPETS